MTNRKYDDSNSGDDNWDDKYGTFDWINRSKPSKPEEEPDPKAGPRGIILPYEYPQIPDEKSNGIDFGVFIKRDSKDLVLSIIRSPILNPDMHILVFLDMSIDTNPNADESIFNYIRILSFPTFEKAKSHAELIISDWKKSAIVKSDTEGILWKLSVVDLINFELRRSTILTAFNYN